VLSYLLDLEEAFDRIQGIKYLSIQYWLVCFIRSFLPLISVSGRICNNKSQCNLFKFYSMMLSSRILLLCNEALTEFESQILYHRKEIFVFLRSQPFKCHFLKLILMDRNFTASK
jgi:hypothetical protein